MGIDCGPNATVVVLDLVTSPARPARRFYRTISTTAHQYTNLPEPIRIAEGKFEHYQRYLEYDTVAINGLYLPVTVRSDGK